MNRVLLLIDDKKDMSYLESLIAFKKLFKGYLEIDIDNPECLTLEKLRDYRLVITYDHVSLQNTSVEFASKFISYVAGGGGWLALHNGTLVGNSDGLATLLGARKTSELPDQTYDFIITTPEHPAMQATKGFKMTSKAYQYAFSTIRPGPRQNKRALLFEYLHNMTVGTGGWAQEFCLGKVVGSGLCSDIKCLDNSMFAQIIRQCGLWAAGETAHQLQ